MRKLRTEIRDIDPGVENQYFLDVSIPSNWWGDQKQLMVEYGMSVGSVGAPPPPTPILLDTVTIDGAAQVQMWDLDLPAMTTGNCLYIARRIFRRDDDRIFFWDVAEQALHPRLAFASPMESFYLIEGVIEPINFNAPLTLQLGGWYSDGEDVFSVQPQWASALIEPAINLRGRSQTA